MKVLMISPFPLPGMPAKGGVEMVATNLVPELGERIRRKGGELRVLTLAQPHVVPGTVKNAWGDLVWIPRHRSAAMAILATDRKAILGECGRFKPDLVHSQGVASWLLGLDGPKKLVTIHGLQAAEKKVGSLGRSIASRLGGYLKAGLLEGIEQRGRAVADAIVSISPYVDQFLCEGSLKKLRRVENPLDQSVLRGSDRSQASVNVVYVGRVIPRKNLKLLIMAMAKLNESGGLGGAKLEIWCPQDELAGEYARECQSLVRKLDLGQLVIWRGEAAKEDLAAAYASAAVSVVPSLQETAPMAVAESLALGVPVVATDVGGVGYMIDHGVDGHLVPSGNVDALAASLHFWLGNPHARAIAARHGLDKATSRWSSLKIVEATMGIYEGLLRS